MLPAAGLTSTHVLALMASLERYSKHPLAKAIVAAATEAGVALRDASEVSEPAGRRTAGRVDGSRVEIASRATLLRASPRSARAAAGRRGRHGVRGDD